MKKPQTPPHPTKENIQPKIPEELHPDAGGCLVSFETFQVLRVFQWLTSISMMMKSIPPTLENS